VLMCQRHFPKKKIALLGPCQVPINEHKLTSRQRKHGNVQNGTTTDKVQNGISHRSHLLFFLVL
jgi:hypothetical protein